MRFSKTTTTKTFLLSHLSLCQTLSVQNSSTVVHGENKTEIYDNMVLQSTYGNFQWVKIHYKKNLKLWQCIIVLIPLHVYSQLQLPFIIG